MSTPNIKTALIALALFIGVPATAHAQSADSGAAEEPRASTERAAAAPAIAVRMGVRALHRQFDYHDTRADHVPGSARPFSFDMPLGPAPFAELELFPLELTDGTRRPVDVALIGGAERLIGTHTVVLQGTPQRTSLQTSSSQYYGGLRGRLLLGAHELGLTGAYGQHTFAVSDLTLGTQRAGLVPNVSYSFARLALDARLHFNAVSVAASVGTRFVRNTGPLQADWFPSTSTSVLEGNLSLGYALSSFSSLLVGVDYLRYAFDFNPVPSNSPVIAGGAVDQYLSGWLALEFHYSADASPPRARAASRSTEGFGFQ